MALPASSNSKRCRALRCVRRIPDAAIFCNTHLGMLSPRYLRPVEANREPTTVMEDAVARRIVSGTNDAVRQIARLEGRAGDLAEVRRASTNANAGGTNGAPGLSTGGSGGGGYRTDKPDANEN